MTDERTSIPPVNPICCTICGKDLTPTPEQLALCEFRRTHGRRTWTVGRMRFLLVAVALHAGRQKVYFKRRGWTLHFGRLNGRWHYGLDRFDA